MPTAALRLSCLAALVMLLAACNPVTDFSQDDSAAPHGFEDLRPAGAADAADRYVRQVDVACPCFNRRALANATQDFVADQQTSEFYLFFDTFNYFGLDARRTEARALVSTDAGLQEEVAAVYITPGSSPNDLHLICYRQEVVNDPITNDPAYEYRTVETTIPEAEACRQAIYSAVGTSEPCQGPACGLPYTKEQLDPSYPPYNDGSLAPETLHDSIRRAVAEVASVLTVSA